MAKVILEIDEKYAGALSITAIGSTGLTTHMSTQGVDLSKHNHLVLCSDGRWTNTFCPTGELLRRYEPQGEIEFDYGAED